MMAFQIEEDSLPVTNISLFNEIPLGPVLLLGKFAESTLIQFFENSDMISVELKLTPLLYPPVTKYV